jgi:hypothetical protein
VDTHTIIPAIECEFAPKNRPKSEGSSGLGEAHDAVETVVISERETRESEPRALGGELFGVARPVEKAEARVGVEFAVGGHQS